jgi:hypothetical protein
MPETLSSTEVGKEIAERAGHAGERHDRLVSIVEAILLSVVALVAGWSGYSAAKWGTESSLDLAKASSTRAEANRAYQQALTYRVGDAVTFNAWLSAHYSGNRSAQRITQKRFLPELRVAFAAWIATHPFTNPAAPAGPQSMPQYHAPGAAQAARLDSQAEASFATGQDAAGTEDDYVRTTVILASVLFLVGISTQFDRRGIRLALVSVAGVLLLAGLIAILALPGPPS